MKEKIKYLLGLILMIVLFSCDDVFEEDISDDILVIINPQDGDIIEGNTVQFLWNMLEGVDDYTIQVYSTNTLVLDTVVTSPPFVDVLNSGLYEWRIKGQNNGYETQYNFPAAFEVMSSNDLTNQTVVLNNPSNEVYTNDTSLIFTWSAVPSALTYSFELLKETTSGSTVVYLDEELTTTSIELDNTTLSEDAEYQWKVKAVNATTETSYFSRTFFLDTEDPSSPSLVSPQFEEEFVLADTIAFSWDFGVDPGPIDSTITSFYDIASDASFTTIVESGSSINTLFNFTFANTGTYFWRVRGEDEAGNIGAFNQNGKLIVNE